MAQNSKALAFSSGNFVWPGDALSTSVKSIRADLGSFAKISHARIVAVWTCQPGAVLRVVKADSGPVNIENVGAWVYPTVFGSPTVNAVDITSELQSVFDCGALKHIGIQLSGAGTLNRATIEIVWEIDMVPADITGIIDRIESLENAATANVEQPPVTEIEVPPEGLNLRFIRTAV